MEWESSLLLCHRGRLTGLHKGQVILRVNRNSYRFSCLVKKNGAMYCGVLTDEVTKTLGSQVT